MSKIAHDDLMPKLDATHLPQRISARLADLKAGKEVSIRDIKALLNDEQITAMEAAWNAQQALRKGKQARNKEQEKELGWRSKREVYIEAYEQAFHECNSNLLSAYKKKLKDAEVRAAKIYSDAFFSAKADDKDYWQADSAGKNALSRSGIETDFAGAKLNAKLQENIRIEKQLEFMIESKMTPDELEQYELLQEHERNVKK